MNPARLLLGFLPLVVVSSIVGSACVIEETETSPKKKKSSNSSSSSGGGEGGGFVDPGTGGQAPSSTSTSSTSSGSTSSTSSSGSSSSTSSSGSSSSTSSSSTSSGGSGAAPGQLCNCDADCQDLGGQNGICVYGVCMVQAKAPCSDGGSTAECPDGMRCWGMEGEDGYICWPDCASFTCKGGCDQDGSCVPKEGMNCGYKCGSYCACTPNDCGPNESCLGGKCMANPDVGGGPGPGPGPSCNGLPTRDCSGTAKYCGELVVFDPRVTAHYDDYPINGETQNNQYRSYLRRDLKMLIDYATAKVLCKATGWKSGIGGALGLGDMSEKNGDIPGTSIGQPGHPQGTHEDGYDIDVGYYQTPPQKDNHLRPVCKYANEHCTEPPIYLDKWRHALFLGHLFESKRTRVVGVDGQVGLVVEPALLQLCKDNWLTSEACNNVRLAYEVTNKGYGWYYFHHHHSHVSLCPGSGPCQNANALLLPGAGAQMPAHGQGLDPEPLKPNPGRRASGLPW
ncbi:MAG: hypothetical protein HY744_08150 [Deltaproteobacteria bacterium]|nr:hypothetical protein [Deltaproteobacteria bacterium]